MKELIEALHVIQDECKKYVTCTDCPMCHDGVVCAVTDLEPNNWKINDEMMKALL